MVRRSAPALLAALAAVTLASPARAAKPKIAAMEVRPERGVDPGLARLLDEVLLAELSVTHDVLGRSDIASMLGFEQQKQMLGCSEEASCLAELGGALGVRLVVSGNLGQVGRLYLVNLKLLDTAQAKVVKRITETVSGSEEQLVHGVQRAVRRLVSETDSGGSGLETAIADANATAPAPPPVATAPTPPAPAPLPDAPAAKRRSNALPWTGVALGAVAVGTGAYFGVSAIGTAEDVRANLARPAVDGAKLRVDAELRARHSLEANLANGLVGGGLALALVSWLFVDSSGEGAGDGAILLVPDPARSGFALQGPIP